MGHSRHGAVRPRHWIKWAASDEGRGDLPVAETPTAGTEGAKKCDALDMGRVPRCGGPALHLFGDCAPVLSTSAGCSMTHPWLTCVCNTACGQKDHLLRRKKDQFGSAADQRPPAGVLRKTTGDLSTRGAGDPASERQQGRTRTTPKRRGVQVSDQQPQLLVTSKKKRDTHGLTHHGQIGTEANT